MKYIVTSDTDQGYLVDPTVTKVIFEGDKITTWPLQIGTATTVLTGY